MQNECRRIVTVNEMKAAENHTYAINGITPLDLMERAGTAIYHYLKDNDHLEKGRVLVMCGCGNNGGDGLVLSRLLFENNYQVNVIVFDDNKNATQENTVNLKRLPAKCPLIRATPHNINSIREDIMGAGIIIDAIFGTGLNRDVEGEYREIIRVMRRAGAYVISVDVPSGINGNNGRRMGEAVRAARTLVIQHYKTGNLLNDSCDYQGKTVLLDVGIELPSSLPERRLMKPGDLKHLIKPRLKNVHKYHFGKAVIFGGNKDMGGAALLASAAALRCGAGLATLAIRNKYRRYVTGCIPEVIVNGYSGNRIGKIVDKANAFAFGPGLGKTLRSNFFLVKALLKIDRPVVIDADGLYYFKKYRALASNNIIITPHGGELAALIGCASSEVCDNPLRAIARAAGSGRHYTILKGASTIIAGGGETYFYCEPNSGLATAGSGDVLTGIITSFLAQGYHPLEAARAAVILHSLAARAAVEKYGEHGMIASDIIAFLPEQLIKAVRESSQIDKI